MFLESFPTTDGRARFVPVTPERPRERPNAEFPYLLTTGRSRGHYQSGAQTRRSPTLQGAEPEAYAELHPELAAAIGVADRAHVRLRTRRGNVVPRARLTPGIRRDTVFVPFHWSGESGANALTNAALDPTSRMRSSRPAQSLSNRPTPAPTGPATNGHLPDPPPALLPNSDPSAP
ncbi:MAG: molybdopterin oxidoreductase family protein [Pseudonocardiaceae bacterium]